MGHIFTWKIAKFEPKTCLCLRVNWLWVEESWQALKYPGQADTAHQNFQSTHNLLYGKCTKKRLFTKRHYKELMPG